MAEITQGPQNPIGAGSSIYKAVVLDVINDLSQINKHAATMQIRYKVKNSTRILEAPLNSCIIKFYGTSGPIGENGIVAYPFFPPHLALPVKPGEVVWVISPPLNSPSPEDCFWVCRITANNKSDDINFTHLFRQSKTPPPSELIPTSEKLVSAQAGQFITNIVEGFQNSLGGEPILKTGPNPEINPFDTIVTQSIARKTFVGEPAPYFSKRPSDLIIQGSNNSLICLGQDRAYDFDFDGAYLSGLTGSLSTTKPALGTGTIDIVTGRSRYMPLSSTTAKTNGTESERTGIKTKVNTREYNEIDKRSFNPPSGELDFTVDASRIYVSMKTNGDKCFGLTSELGRMPVGFVSGSIVPVDDAAYITLKSDELRLIARKQNENEYFPESTNPEINGSIKIIKEGVVNEDFAAVMLLPDGTIQINGSKIFLGRTIADGGIGGGPGEDESQPYVKYQDLENLWNATMDALDSFCQTLSTHTTPGYGAPSPQIIEAAATLKAEIASALKPDIVNIQSTRIFGE